MHADGGKVNATMIKFYFAAYKEAAFRKTTHILNRPQKEMGVMVQSDLDARQYQHYTKIMDWIEARIERLA